MTSRLLLLTLCAAGLVVAGVAGAEGPALRGSVGPGFTISLSDGSGAAVRQLDPGTFTLTVDDRSDEHNFHLSGPGVDVSTEVEAIETKTFSVVLAEGKYSFFCDPHAGTMRGTFTVGTPASEPAPPKVPAPKRLVLTVTAKSVTLKTPAGQRVTALPAGPVVISVRDRSAVRGLRLRGAGVSRTTGVRFVGARTWRVRLSAGTLVYASDARKPVLKGGRVPVS